MKRRTVMTALAVMAVATGAFASPADAAAPNRNVVGSAGYSAQIPADPTVLTAQIKVPVTICSSATQGWEAFAALSVGVNAQSSVQESCYLGVASYQAMVVLENTVKEITVSAGDVVRFTVESEPTTGAGSTKVIVRDVTTSQSVSSALVGQRPPTQAALILIPNGPVADFGKLVWSNATINGTPFASFNPTGYNMLRGPKSTALAVVTTPWSTSGTSFKNIWRSTTK